MSTENWPEELQPVLRWLRTVPGDEKHDSSALSTLPVLWVLYDRILRFDPTQPRNDDRDRFILSKGHGPLAFYTILALKGFFPLELLPTFTRWESPLGGHPDRLQVPGVEASTGSLGHGFPMAVGQALALRARGIDRRVFVLVGDGECNEGSIWEAALLAGHFGLSGLTGIQVDNHSSTLQPGDWARKFSAFGWAVRTVPTLDLDAIENALRIRDPSRPSLVVVDVPEEQES